MPQPRKPTKVICEHCQSVTYHKPSIAKSRRFCDRNCQTAFNEQLKETVKCLECGKEMAAYKKHKRIFCSISCAISHRNKTDANPSYHRDVSGKNNPMYGKGHLLAGENNPMYGRKGKDSPAWRGGRKTRKDGYVLCYVPHHPNALSDGGGTRTYVLEHRIVMEDHLGRFLESGEIVHHKDGDPSNNDIDNLELFSSQSDHISNGHKHKDYSSRTTVMM